MIESIKIDNFRGIHRCKIEGLSQVNLFFGKNNCGKSSLLESLFLVCGQSNPLLPATLNAMRTYTRLTESDIHYFFYQMNAASEIQIETTGARERHLAITTFQEAADVSAGNVSTEIEQRHQVDKRYTEQLRCAYLSPRYDSNASMEGL